MAINSKEKGKRGEAELARILTGHGYKSRRGQQFSAANGDPDVVGLPYIHIEAKRVERLNIEDAMSQSIHDAREGEIPAVFHRKNRSPWLVTMRLEDWIEIYREWEAGKSLDQLVYDAREMTVEEAMDAYIERTVGTRNTKIKFDEVEESEN